MGWNTCRENKTWFLLTEDVYWKQSETGEKQILGTAQNEI